MASTSSRKISKITRTKTNGMNGVLHTGRKDPRNLFLRKSHLLADGDLEISSIRLSRYDADGAESPFPEPILNEAYLRFHLMQAKVDLVLGPDSPINLWTVSNTRPAKRRRELYPLHIYVKLAIWGSPQRSLTLDNIKKAIRERFALCSVHLDDESPQWETTIRHILSADPLLRHTKGPSNGLGQSDLWFLDYRGALAAAARKFGCIREHQPDNLPLNQGEEAGKHLALGCTANVGSSKEVTDQIQNDEIQGFLPVIEPMYHYSYFHYYYDTTGIPSVNSDVA